jgi:hypothetical protein
MGGGGRSDGTSYTIVNYFGNEDAIKHNLGFITIPNTP